MVPTVRCKFTCVSQTKRKGWAAAHPIVYDYEFNVVTGGSAENEAFFAATPSGSFKVSTTSIESFEVGKDYYLDIIPIAEG